MASTKLIKAEYSAKLDGMAKYIYTFHSNHNLNKEKMGQVRKGVADFCYKNTINFKQEFLRHAGLISLQHLSRRSPSDTQSRQFISRLSKIDGECIFLLKDTHDVLRSYQQKTGKGFGILANRKFLCRTEEDYFLLIKMIYDTLSRAKNQNDFLKKYLLLFSDLIKNDIHFHEKAKTIADYVISRTRSQKIVFVDLGFQFTLSLFCAASLHHFSKNKTPVDIYSFSVYPWLQKFFQGKYFSTKSEVVLALELQAIKNFQMALEDRKTGALLGFAIGDALGFPVAGIHKSDVHKFFDSRITGFANNPKHPFFSHLHRGQYTENTNLLIVSARHLIKNRDFIIDKYQNDLAAWGQKILKSPATERWAGPTAINAINNLINGQSYHTSGSKTTESCSATYRVLPLGAFYHPFSQGGSTKLKNAAEMSAMITHNSEISKTGAIITALIIADLVHGVLPENAVRGSLAEVHVTSRDRLLISRIKQAIIFSKTKSIAFARKTLGTGSPIYQTLPLAIFCFLKFQNDFEKAVLAAACSYRDDTPQEKKRLRNFSWDEQLRYAKGGNTDGIAGLTGAFVGAYIGYRQIPSKFLEVENKDEIISLSRKLTEAAR